jgi:hypothetical protein
MSTNGLMKCVAACVLAGAPMASAIASDDGSWTWVVEPYLWASSIRTNLKVDVPPIENSNTSDFHDLISKISFAAELHVEAQTDQFGLFGDLMYISADDSHNRPDFSSKSSVSASVTELAGVWSPDDTRFSGFEGFAGIRSFGTTFKFDLTPADPALARARIHINENWTDVMIGVRYTATLSDRWALTFRGDGGFGDTDSNYNASAMARYRTGNGAWLVGYRYMDTKFDTRGRKLNLEMYGPVIAYAFVF